MIRWGSMSVFYEFLSFIRSGKASGRKSWLADFIMLFFVLLAFRLAIVIGKALLTGQDVFSLPKDEEAPMFSAFFTYVLLVPLIEEMVFRGFLGVSKNKISVYFIALAGILGSLFYIKVANLLFPVLFIILLVCYAYLRIRTFQKKVDAFIENYYYFLVIVSVLSFAGAHITNYEDYSLATLVALLPRVVSGFYLAYIVTKYNIWYAWFMHVVNNALPFITMLFIG